MEQQQPDRTRIVAGTMTKRWTLDKPEAGIAWASSCALTLYSCPLAYSIQVQDTGCWTGYSHVVVAATHAVGTNNFNYTAQSSWLNSERRVAEIMPMVDMGSPNWLINSLASDRGKRESTICVILRLEIWYLRLCGDTLIKYRKVDKIKEIFLSWAISPIAPQSNQHIEPSPLLIQSIAPVHRTSSSSGAIHPPKSGNEKGKLKPPLKLRWPQKTDQSKNI